MKSAFVFLFLLCTSYFAFSQGSKQIASRHIKVVSSKTTDMRKGELAVKFSVVTYDRKGRMTESKEFNADSLLTGTETFSYTKKDDVAEHCEFDSKGKLVRKTKTDYDKFGKEISSMTFIDSGKLLEKTVLAYDKFENRKEEIVTDGNGQLLKRTIFEYDNKGMLLSRKSYNSKGELIYEKINSYTY